MNTPRIVGDSPWFDNERSWLDAKSSATWCRKLCGLVLNVQQFEAECSAAGYAERLPGLMPKVPWLDAARCLWSRKFCCSVPEVPQLDVNSFAVWYDRYHVRDQMQVIRISAKAEGHQAEEKVSQRVNESKNILTNCATWGIGYGIGHGTSPMSARECFPSLINWKEFFRETLMCNIL